MAEVKTWTVQQIEAEAANHESTGRRCRALDLDGMADNCDRSAAMLRAFAAQTRQVERDALLREVQALRVRVADLELVIASANNSLYGSEGPFLNRNGSDVPDRFHLSGPIEDLKRDAKQVQALREKVQAATDQCDRILRLYSSPLVGEDEAECVKRRAIYSIVEKIRGKVSR